MTERPSILEINNTSGKLPSSSSHDVSIAAADFLFVSYVVCLLHCTLLRHMRDAAERQKIKRLMIINGHFYEYTNLSGETQCI